jgi:SAM-dependent methyltransferase
VYDRVGRRQDVQGWYEGPAVDLLVRHGRFAAARAVVEVGAGTGRLAARLLRDALPPWAAYRATDLSPVMVGIARQRLAPFGARATASLTDGAPPDGPPGSADRFVAAYVLDTLSEPAARGMLAAAHRLLRPGGLVCLASLGEGVGPLSRAVAAGWRAAYRVRPEWLGGCRPVSVRPLLDAGRWAVRFHARPAPYAVPSDVVVAEALGPERGRGAGG